MQKLAESPQAETLFITCTDSDHLNALTCSGPGDMFATQYRNLCPRGNSALVGGSRDAYAVDRLGSRSIVVCGHWVRDGRTGRATSDARTNTWLPGWHAQPGRPRSTAPSSDCTGGAAKDFDLGRPTGAWSASPSGRDADEPPRQHAARRRPAQGDRGCSTTSRPRARPHVRSDSPTSSTQKRYASYRSWPSANHQPRKAATVASPRGDLAALVSRRAARRPRSRAPTDQ